MRYSSVRTFLSYTGKWLSTRWVPHLCCDFAAFNPETEEYTCEIRRDNQTTTRMMKLLSLPFIDMTSISLSDAVFAMNTFGIEAGFYTIYNACKSLIRSINGDVRCRHFELVASWLTYTGSLTPMDYRGIPIFYPTLSFDLVRSSFLSVTRRVLSFYYIYIQYTGIEITNSDPFEKCCYQRNISILCNAAVDG